MPSTNGSGPSREAWPRNAASTRPTKPIHFCRGPGDRSPSEQIVFCRGPFGGAHRLHEQVVRVNLLFIPLGRLSDEHRIYISETPILPFRHYFRLSSAKSHMNSVTYADPTRDFAPLRPGAVEVGLDMRSGFVGAANGIRHGRSRNVEAQARNRLYESDGCVKYNAPGGGVLLLRGGWGKSSSTRDLRFTSCAIMTIGRSVPT